MSEKTAIRPSDEAPAPQADEDQSQTSEDIRTSRYSHLLLFFAVFLCFGTYYVYDNPVALQTQLQERLQINSLEYNMFYCIYALPNLIVPLFGGLFLDYTGVRPGIIIYASIIVAGQCIFALGVAIKHYYIALSGRFVFALGGENLAVAQGVVVANWFLGRHLSFALGLILGISRLGSVINDYSEPEIDDATGSPVLGLWVGAIVCTFSLACGLGIVWLDRKRDLSLAQETKLPDKVNIRDIAQFGPRLWLIAVNCMVVYVTVISFMENAAQFFQLRYNYGKVESGYLIGTLYLVAAAVCPLFGCLVDAVGYRTWFITFSATLSTVVHLVYIMIPDCDECSWGVISLALLGISDSCYASVTWACVPYTVPSTATGTGFGIVTVFMNFGLGLGSLAVGLLRTHTSPQHGFYYVGWFFVFMGSIGILTGVLLTIADKRSDGLLNSKSPPTSSQESLEFHDLQETD